MALAFRSTHHRKQSPWEQKSDLRDLANKFRPAKTRSEEPIIPPASIFATLSDDHDTTATEHGSLPSVAECAVHLEFLEATLILKQKVLTSNALDRAFGLTPHDKLETVGTTRTRKRDPDFKKLQALKWKIFLRLASARFSLWWKALDFILPKADGAEHVCLTSATLPPLDVLMVWHAFLLNPSDYKGFCNRPSGENRLQLNLPWKDVHKSLSDNNFTFTLSPEATAHFTTHIGDVDLFKTLSAHETHSPETLDTLRNLVSSDGKSAPRTVIPSVLPSIPSATFWAACGVLANQVERQALFAQNMGERLWLRSPALEGTVSRAFLRFERFMALFKELPGTMLVPTRDIDLVWHTLQCAPLRYEEACLKMAGREINHNDALGDAKLKGGFKETNWLYEQAFQDEYNACLCWECETLRSRLEKLEPGKDIDFADIAKKTKDDVMYHRAVEYARRRKERLPVREYAPL